jgi:hypothetical protein
MYVVFSAKEVTVSVLYCSYPKVRTGACDDLPPCRCNAMKSVGLSDDEIQSVWKVPAGVLSLLNVNFRREGEGCDIDPSTNRYVEHAAKPWAITEATLRHEFVTTTITLSGNNKITKQYNVTGANDTRDALCKAAYDDIFGDILAQCVWAFTSRRCPRRTGRRTTSRSASTMCPLPDLYRLRWPRPRICWHSPMEGRCYNLTTSKQRVALGGSTRAP